MPTPTLSLQLPYASKLASRVWYFIQQATKTNYLTLKRDGTDDRSVYAGQPAIRLSHRRVYDRTNVDLGAACIVPSC